MINEENISTPGSHPRRAFDLSSTPLGVVRQAQSDLALFLLATNYQLGLNRFRQRTHIMVRKPYKLSSLSIWAAEWYSNGPTAGTFVHSLHWIRGLTDKMRDEFLEYLRSEDQLGKYEEWLSGEPTAIGPDKDITSEKLICGIVYDICHDGLWQLECCHHNGEPIFEEAAKEVLDGIPLGISPLSKKALLSF